MTELTTKSKFSVPIKYPMTSRVPSTALRGLSTALVGSVFAAELAHAVIDVDNTDALDLFQISRDEHANLPLSHPHPRDIEDHTLRAQVLEDSGWYKRYEDQHRNEQVGLTECKQWLLAVLPPDVHNQCIDAAGGEGMEHRPAFTVRRMIPFLVSALEAQKPTELRSTKSAMEKPFTPQTETLESWLTCKRRLAALATTHLAYTFNDHDILLSVWNGLAPLHLDTIATFKLAWTTKTSSAQRTFSRLTTDILEWERTMVDSEQSVFEPTRASAGYRATTIPPSSARTDATQQDITRALEAANVTTLSSVEVAILVRYIDAGNKAIAHKKANPSFTIPPKTCALHGMCYHDTTQCKSGKPTNL